MITTKHMTLNKTIHAFLFLATLCFFACKETTRANNNTAKKDDKLPLELLAVQTAGGGWGYEVYVDNKLYIKQDNIPAVQGFQRFKTKEDALKIGKLVIEKMKQGKKFPAVKIEELEKENIAMDR